MTVQGQHFSQLRKFVERKEMYTSRVDNLLSNILPDAEHEFWQFVLREDKHVGDEEYLDGSLDDIFSQVTVTFLDSDTLVSKNGVYIGYEAYNILSDDGIYDNTIYIVTEYHSTRGRILRFYGARKILLGLYGRYITSTNTYNQYT